MRQLTLELDEKILTQAERLASERGMTIEQLFAELVNQAGQLV